MKITNMDRECITKKATEDVFQARKATVTTEENAVACLIYDAIYPPRIQQQMAALPDEFFTQKSAVYAPVRDETEGFTLLSSRKVAARDTTYHRPYLGVADQPLLDRIAAHHSARQKLKSDQDLFKQELKMFLAGISTDKQLKDVWPEGEAYYAYLFKPLTRNLPAVQSEGINNLIQQMKA